MNAYYFINDLIRLRPAGEPPSPRAAHAAAAVGTMVVFQVIRVCNGCKFIFL